MQSWHIQQPSHPWSQRPLSLGNQLRQRWHKYSRHWFSHARYSAAEHASRSRTLSNKCRSFADHASLAAQTSPSASTHSRVAVATS
eukprot:CAMPEP_0198575548 /NCGR_PEP_ID=MMETSP1462-20131121/116316_1 /TAXON_ID=1333877 /ORGANISM="Brandtodinium nutriculum, Strain RCC3387" /LENGTH=85 /DNA_ID=CAMNT_0044306795 /DNA_START=86 /DNA_END=340 /DNA_ORIENTATION=+